jgi:transposase-like protein
MGKLPLAIPRDRDGTFEPLLLGKYQRRLPGFDEKILALYAKGLTTRDIQDIVQELYLARPLMRCFGQSFNRTPQARESETRVPAACGYTTHR